MIFIYNNLLRDFQIWFYKAAMTEYKVWEMDGRTDGLN